METQTAITLLTIMVGLLTFVIVTWLAVIIVLLVKLNKLITNVNDMTVRVQKTIDTAFSWLTPKNLLGSILDIIRKKK